MRVNLFTDERKVLTAEDNESALVPCYQGDTGNILSDWECYSIWRQRNHTLEPLPEVWSEAQRVYIEKDYQKKLIKDTLLTLISILLFCLEIKIVNYKY